MSRRQSGAGVAPVSGELTLWLQGGVPRRVRSGQLPTVEVIDGTVLMIDVVGFTRLSERLAKYGSAGTELMISTITAALSGLTSAVESHGGDVLLIAGDALLVLFEGPMNAERAYAAAEAARRELRAVARVETPAGNVVLKVSQGMASGPIGLIDAGDEFAALVPWGPTVVAAFAAEKSANAGEINVHTWPNLLPPTISAVNNDNSTRDRRADVPPTPYIAPTITAQLPDIAYDHEHRTVSTAFVNWPDLGSSLHVAADKATALVNRAAAICAINDVTLTCVEPTGFGLRLMLTAGAPLSNENDADALLRSVFQLLDAEPDLQPSVGVTRGLAFAGIMGTIDRWTWSAMGDCVNVAARLAAKASPGQVFVDDGVVAALGSRLDSQELQSVQVHSRRGAVTPHLVSRAPIEPAAPVSVEFCGRDDELRDLNQWLDDPASATRVLAIRGVPGVGSSALAERALANRERIELRGRADQQLVPFGSLQRELRRLLKLTADASMNDVARELNEWIQRNDPNSLDDIPLIMSALGSQSTFQAGTQESGRTLRLVTSVSRLLASALGADGLLYLDRPQLLDATSQIVVRDLAASLTFSGPRILIAARTDESIPIDVDQTTELQPLGEEESRRIAAQILEQRHQPTIVAVDVAAQGHGIPRHIIAIAQTWSPHVGQLPTDVESLLARQIDALPATLRRLVRYLSIIGEVAPTSLVRETLADSSDERLSELAHVFERESVLRQLGGLLEETGGDQIRFADPLIRQVAYRSLSFKRRRQLHGRVGQILEEQEAHPAIVAHHFLQAGMFAKAWRWSNRAGDAAHAAGAFNESADAYSMAMDAAGEAGIDLDVIARTAERWGDSARMAARYPEASKAYKQAGRGGAPGAQPRLLTKRAWVEGDQGHYAQAIRLTSQAIKVAGPLPRHARDRALAAAYVRRAGIRIRQGRFTDAEEAIRRSLDHAAQTGNEWSARAYLLLDSVLVDTGRSELAHEPRAKALATYRTLGDWEGVGQALNNYGIDAYWNGELDAAAQWYRQSLDAFTKAGDAIGIAMATNNLGEVASDLGELDEAEQHFSHFLITSARAGNEQFVAHAYMNLAVIKVRRGRAAEAIPLLDQAVTRFEALGSNHFADQARVHRVTALIDADDLTSARNELDDILATRHQRTGLATMTSTIDSLAERLGLT